MAFVGEETRTVTERWYACIKTDNDEVREMGLEHLVSVMKVLDEGDRFACLVALGRESDKALEDAKRKVASLTQSVINLREMNAVLITKEHDQRRRAVALEKENSELKISLTAYEQGRALGNIPSDGGNSWVLKEDVDRTVGGLRKKIQALEERLMAEKAPF